MTLGPYALVLSYILSNTDNRNKPDKIYVYRGMRISKQLFREQYGYLPQINHSELSINSSMINFGEEIDSDKQVG